MNFRPTYEITIGNYLLSSRGNNRLLRLTVEATLGVPVNVCRIVLPQLGDMLLETGMPVKVQLGYDSKQEKTFTGSLQLISRRHDTLELKAVSAFQHLINRKGSIYFDHPTAAAIVLDLCSQCELVPARVETGLHFSFYALGEDRSYYEHLLWLAAQCGFDLYADQNDHLVFGTNLPGQVFAFESGKNILQLKWLEQLPAVTSVEVFGESPASLGQGTKAAGWFTKKEIKGGAGDGVGAVRRIISPTIRTLENASRVARALQQQWSNQRRGRLQVAGMPKIHIGDQVQINETASVMPGTLFKVTGLAHHLHAQTGFISQFKIEEQ